MKVIGLTGGIASGKSTVSQVLRNLGAVILDADQVAREIVAPSQPAWQEIVKAFGPEILQSDGQIDRVALGQLVFADPKARQKLNALTHPVIRAEFERRLAVLRAKQPHCIAVVDAPLLMEAEMTDLVDEIWVVAVDVSTQIQRLMARDGLSVREAQQRIASQMPLAEKLKVADRVINNQGSRVVTKQQVRHLWAQLQESPTYD